MKSRVAPYLRVVSRSEGVTSLAPPPASSIPAVSASSGRAARPSTLSPDAGSETAGSIIGNQIGATPHSSFFLRLPVPPSTNHLYATIGRKRVRSQKYKAWLSEAGWEIVRRRPNRLIGRVNFSMAVPRNLRRDLDNFLKAPLDLLVEHSLIEDDSKVERISVTWHDEDLDEAFIEVWSIP